jgi:hypothetical protein
MIKRYFLPLLQGACFMIVSLFLQSCGGPHDLPIEGEAEPSTTITIVQQEEQRLIEQGQATSSLDIFPSEIWQEIFSHLDFEGVLSARAVNSDWNQLITGYREAGIVGVENNPHHIINIGGWTSKKETDFRESKLKTLTPTTIPRFAFYHLIGHVICLPQAFWPYLKGTQVHTLDLRFNGIGDAGVRELATVLPATRVHTLDLRFNGIGAAGIRELATVLPATRVHTLGLNDNQIGAEGARELVKILPATRVHTLNLGSNDIEAAGVSELAKSLPATRVIPLYMVIK